MNVHKVYEGLKEVNRQDSYHLGHYSIDFQDGELRFELMVNICANEKCPCDSMLVTIRAQDTILHAWYNSKREWVGHENKTLPENLIKILRNIESTADFQERMSHLQYLRRLQVLQEKGLDKEFVIHVPKELIRDGVNPGDGVLGRIRIKVGKNVVPYHIHFDFCSKEDCFCETIFLSVISPKDEILGYAIDSEDQWQINDALEITEKLFPKVKMTAMRLKWFKELLAVFRQQRMLHNYFRFVEKYPKKIGLNA